MMNKLPHVVLFAVLLCGSVWAAQGNLPGSGTKEDPWLIEDFEDFQAFCADPEFWDDYTRLDCDLDLNPALQGRQTYTAAPIAGDIDNNSGYDGTAYAGHFDGNGRAISNLTIDGALYCGLFGQTGSESGITNLGMENVSIAGAGWYVGGLVGKNGRNGHITNCYSTGSVSGGGYHVGGLVGYNDGGDITNCYSTGPVSGRGYVGGLVGYNGYSYITSCYSTGSVSGDGYVGGLVGANNVARITNCYSTGSVSGDSDRVGGLVGYNRYDASITNCYSTGSVSGDRIVGGLVGWNYGRITNCYSAGSVSGDSVVGGLVGSNNFHTGLITNCYSTGSVSSDSAVGGLVGYNSGGSIINCHSTGSVSGTRDVGGLVGYNSGGSITYCHSTGLVSGYDEVGGLVGDNSYGSITNCYSTGSVSGDSSVGGLVGLNDSFITGCFWDIESSGITTSDGGSGVMGLATAQMQDIRTFMNAGWDFVGEDDNGQLEVWYQLAGEYPKLHWQAGAGDMDCDGSVDMSDLALIADDWLVPTTESYRSYGDVNFDGVSDLSDLAIFAGGM